MKQSRQLNWNSTAKKAVQNIEKVSKKSHQKVSKNQKIWEKNECQVYICNVWHVVIVSKYNRTALDKTRNVS